MSGTVITGPETVDAGETLTTTDLDISNAAGLGALTVSGTGAIVKNAGSFEVGAGGLGSLLITNGGLVETSGGPVSIADVAGSDGSSVSVSGKDSTLQITGSMEVGGAAPGSLFISAGGTVIVDSLDSATEATGVGAISVVGKGSALMVTGQLDIGDTGTGQLSIWNGATVTAANADFGVGPNATSNIDIEGAGSHLIIGGDLNLGTAGQAVLTLGLGTELTVGQNINIGAQGVLNNFGGLIDPERLNNKAGGNYTVLSSTTDEYTVGVFNSGTISIAGGTYTLVTPLVTWFSTDEPGTLQIRTNGHMVLNADTVEANQSIFFSDKTGILTIGTLAGFHGVIENFRQGNDIIVQGTSIATTSYDLDTHILTLFDGSASTIGTLQFGEAVVSGKFLVADGQGGIGVAPCFVAGTRISTERGEVAVEDLRIGDRVQVMEGAARPVVWIGYRTVDCMRHPHPGQVWPVRVAPHAFGPNRPCRELWLSPDHAVFVGDVLIPVKHLINGTSIEQVPRDEVTYYHVELPKHAVLLAEGLPAESYLDTGDRGNFANNDGPVTLYPDFASRVWDAAACAQLVVTGPALEAARQWTNAFVAMTFRRAS